MRHDYTRIVKQHTWTVRGNDEDLGRVVWAAVMTASITVSDASSGMSKDSEPVTCKVPIKALRVALAAVLASTM